LAVKGKKTPKEYQALEDFDFAVNVAAAEDPQKPSE
jgi:hypothetical protein